MSAREIARALKEGRLEHAKKIAERYFETAVAEHDLLRARVMLSLLRKIEEKGLKGAEAAKAFENSMKAVFTLTNMLFHTNRMALEKAEKLREKVRKALKDSKGLLPEELLDLVDSHKNSVEKVKEAIRTLREAHKERREIEDKMLKTLREHLKL